MLKSILIFFIKFYRNYFSVLKIKSCRFYPTCSEYAIEAIKTYGAFKGSFLSLLRILRCNPFGRGGYDPLPTKKED